MKLAILSSVKRNKKVDNGCLFRTNQQLLLTINMILFISNKHFIIHVTTVVFLSFDYKFPLNGLSICTCDLNKIVKIEMTINVINLRVLTKTGMEINTQE